MRPTTRLFPDSLLTRPRSVGLLSAPVSSTSSRPPVCTTYTSAILTHYLTCSSDSVSLLSYWQRLVQRAYLNDRRLSPSDPFHLRPPLCRPHVSFGRNPHREGTVTAKTSHIFQNGNSGFWTQNPPGAISKCIYYFRETRVVYTEYTYFLS